MSKNFWIILAVVVVGLFGAFKLTSGKSSTGKSDKYSGGNIMEVKSSDHKIGAGNKKVTILEYGDFQCPSCGAFYPIMEQARTEYKDDITFVFRNFPITSKHKNAQAAARAGEAASKQNKFFEMYSQLYQTQTAWSESNTAQSIFEGYAQQLGLDMTKFKADYASEDTNNVINADMQSGKDANVTGTPGIFVNGVQIENPANYIQFKQIIDDAIAKANPTPAAVPAPAPAQ